MIAIKAKPKVKTPTKNNTRPHLELNQSKKLIKVNGASAINILVKDQKLQTKEFFSLWIKSSTFSKASLFLSFQTIQKIHNEVVFQSFLHFLPTKESCQPRTVSLTIEGKTQDTPKKTKSNCKRTLTFSQ